MFWGGRIYFSGVRILPKGSHESGGAKNRNRRASKRKGKKFVGRRPQAGTLIDGLVAQQMRADGEQRGVIEVGLIIT